MDNAEASPRDPEGPERTEKRLARGLEDVSHLFLSQAPAPAPRPTARNAAQGEAVADARPRPADRVTATSSPALADITQAQIVSLLHSSAGVLEEGLRAIDANIPWETGTTIDLVAVDRRNQLAVIDVDAAGNDALLLRGICHVDWFARNGPIVRRMYTGHAIDFTAEPRLFLVGPRLSPALRRAVERITCLRITCVTYHLVTLPNGTGIFFQHA